MSAMLERPIAVDRTGIAFDKPGFALEATTHLPFGLIRMSADPTVEHGDSVTFARQFAAEASLDAAEGCVFACRTVPRRRYLAVQAQD